MTQNYGICDHPQEGTWRIIPVSEWLGTPFYKPIESHWEGVPQPYLVDLLTMVIDHLQVLG